MKNIFKLLLLPLIFSSCSITKEIRNDTPSPGHAYVEGKIIQLNETGDLIQMKFRVDRIVAYGQATKPIAPSSTLDFELNKNTVKNTFETLQKYSNEQKLLTALISQPKQTVGGTQTKFWDVVFIKE